MAKNTALILALALGLAGSARAETFYPAADASLARGAHVEPCQTCQNGKKVAAIGGDDNGLITFANVAAARGGLYPVTVRFLNVDDASLDIFVNNAAFPRAIIFRRTAQGSNVSSQTIYLPLDAGTNSVAFDNFRESGPELEGIAVVDAPVESHEIAGVIRDASGRPVAGARVDLAARFEQQTRTDAQGRYAFRYLPTGEYHIVPQMAGTKFEPPDHFVAALDSDQPQCDFAARAFPVAPPKPATFASGRWRIDYDLANGVADVFCDGKILLRQIYAAVRLPETVTSMDYKLRKLSRHRVKDKFGRGARFDIECSDGGAEKMVQSFWLYGGADYFLTQVKITGGKKAKSNFMAPIATDTPVGLLPAGDNRALWVPFDNDKWVRYNSFPFGSRVTGYEVTALFNETTRRGLVAGSVDHDMWKTGVRSETSGAMLDGLEIFGGITSAGTRDTLPHGKICGTTIASPRVFVGFFSDWRDGLDQFARANAAAAPSRRWKHGVPFGWNSWGKLAFNISYDKAVEVSDFFASELQPRHFEDDNTVYIGLDAGWNKFSETQLRQFVKHCQANHQQAGIYFTPFADFGRKGDAVVEGSQYHYRDIYLRANGRKQRIAGGIALDPTHPGTRARIKYWVDHFKRWGFKYVKADFMVHGSLEGDRFYDPHVTTGLQAYNSGMKYLDRRLGPSMYLNLAISPLFPAQYANSRRIACDAWGDISKIEYTLNAVTYGWWLGSVYDFNDPDHIVLGGYTDGENRARVTSAAVTGLFISGDDFSKAGDPAGKEKARKYLTNPDVDALIRLRKPFRPLEGNTGDHAADIFSWRGRSNAYIAVFNYSQSNICRTLPLGQLGLETNGAVMAKELWSGREVNIAAPVTVPGADALLFSRRWKDRR